MSKYLPFFFLLISYHSIAQLLQSESRPYRFAIDHVLKFDGISNSSSYDIQPYRNKIRARLEKQISEWHNSEGISYANSPEYQERLVSQIEKRTPIIIHNVGEDALNNSKAKCFFIQETLEFEISFTDFRPFRVGIPLMDVESFRENYDRLEFNNPKITFNDDDEFVITYTEIRNPGNDKKYFFYNTADETIKAPSFNIHLPNGDF